MDFRKIDALIAEEVMPDEEFPLLWPIEVVSREELMKLYPEGEKQMDLRKLDALVAEHVMGWKRYPATHSLPEMWAPPGSPPELNLYGSFAPFYTSNFAEAWMVHDFMCAQGFAGEMLDALPALGATPVEPGSHHKIVSQMVTPLELCLAILKVRDIDTSEAEK